MSSLKTAGWEPCISGSWICDDRHDGNVVSTLHRDTARETRSVSVEFWERGVIAVPILAIVTAAAVLLSLYKYQTVYVAVIDLLPPQFQDGVGSKMAFPEYVLRSSTPLALQAEYVKSQVGFCFATLGVSVLCFLLGKTVAGLIVLVMFFWFAALTIKSWKTYQANCNRRSAADEKE